MTFSAPLDPSYATDAADYHLVNLKQAANPIPIASISYDPAKFAVTIVPQAPFPPASTIRSRSSAPGPTAIRDLAGNLLDGVG